MKIMKIENAVKNILLKIAKKLGLELQEKTENDIEYSEAGLNPTAIGAAVITNIAIDDSDIIIDGNNARAQALRDTVDYFTDQIIYPAAEVSLGTGDCIVRPYTDGKHIGLNIVGNGDFVITKSVGNHLKGIIIKLDEYKTEKGIFRLFESQELKETAETAVVLIRRFAYKNENECDISNTSWCDIQTEETFIADQLLIGRYKCPTINRNDYNSADGVPLTFGCDTIIENIKNKYRQYNEEFDRKEAVIFADKTMYNTEKNKEGLTVHKRSGKEFMIVKGSIDGGVADMIQDYSPAIREADFQNANNFNLSMLELCCGFSRGVFTSPETAFATATEMKNSLKKTFSFVKKFRRRLEAGNKMLFGAINIIMNINGATPLGDWVIRHDWSYDYIEQTTERFNQLLQGHSAGVVKDETLAAWLHGITEEEAKKYIAELKAVAKENEPTDDDIDI
jgi:A118 family predicted phage portal protein